MCNRFHAPHLNFDSLGAKLLIWACVSFNQIVTHGLTLAFNSKYSFTVEHEKRHLHGIGSVLEIAMERKRKQNNVKVKVY